MPRPARGVMAALEQKGFAKRESDHTYFHLWVSGKKTPIFTKVSHGEKEIGDRLLGMMARQIKLSAKQFRDLLDCPLTAEQLIKLLKSAGHIE
jgi:hypothetical protein